MLHELKIEQPYLIHIIECKKTFEVRKNDRDYQVGDRIKFLPLTSEDYDVYKLGYVLQEYMITYITSFGCKEGYVVLGIQECGTKLSC